jgi:hypothetical protein
VSERPFSRRFALSAALEAIEPAVAQLSNPEVVVRLASTLRQPRSGSTREVSVTSTITASTVPCIHCAGGDCSPRSARAQPI